MVPRKIVTAAPVAPRLALARRTFAALVASALDPPLSLTTTFDLIGIGRLRTTTLENFALVDDATDGGGFTLLFDYCGHRPLTYVCASDRVYTLLRKNLFDHGLQVTSVTAVMTNKLTVEPRVSAAISLHPERERVRVTLRNVVMLGTCVYDLPLTALDRRLVDGLVALVAAHDHGVYALLAATRAPARRR